MRSGTPIRPPVATTNRPCSRRRARWEGFLVAPTDAEYSFYMQNMDGARLFIDGQCLIDNWREQEWQTSGRHANMRLTKGSHRLILGH